MLTAVLILAGIVLLVLGVTTSAPVLTAIALALGVVAAVLLLLPVVRPGRPATKKAAEPTTSTPATEPAAPKATEPEASAKAATAKAAAPKAATAKAAAPKAAAAEPTEPGSTESAATNPAGGTNVVLVVPGRHRFHAEGCALLEGRRTERLAPEEARDEGFTACTRCTAAQVAAV